nr:MAG TPA: hypothetical protein [Caudoviricetes sp.]
MHTVHTEPAYALFETRMHEKVSAHVGFMAKTYSTYNLFY